MAEFKVYKRIRLKAKIFGLETHLFSVFVGVGFVAVLGMIGFNFNFKSIIIGGILIGATYGSLVFLQNVDINEFSQRLPKIISK